MESINGGGAEYRSEMVVLIVSLAVDQADIANLNGESDEAALHPNSLIGVQRFSAEAFWFWLWHFPGRMKTVSRHSLNWTNCVRPVA